MADEFKRTPMAVLKESKNDIEAIKTIFDITVKKSGFDGWANKEIERQQDKTINNKIVEFHQEVLGKVDGWVDLGIGDEQEILSGELKKAVELEELSDVPEIEIKPSAVKVGNMTELEISARFSEYFLREDVNAEHFDRIIESIAVVLLQVIKKTCVEKKK